MADETKTQIPKPTRQRGPMGRMGGMRRGEKAKDFKGTMRLYRPAQDCRVCRRRLCRVLGHL